MGFHAYPIAEHHSTPLGMAPIPSVFMASIAQRTKKLRFGPMVYALPLYHPLRMIEEISTASVCSDHDPGFQLASIVHDCRETF